MGFAPVPSSMSAEDFSELIELVPDLLTFLTLSTKKALMSSNRAFRKQIQQATTSIKFEADDEEDVRLLVSKHRPYLRHLDLSSAEFHMGDCTQKALVGLRAVAFPDQVGPHHHLNFQRGDGYQSRPRPAALAYAGFPESCRH